MKCPKVLSVVILAIIIHTAPAQALTLKDGIVKVLTSGLDSRIAHQQELSADAASSRAFASMFPTVDVYAGKTWLQNAPDSSPSPGMVIPLSEDEYVSYGITAKQVIFDFGRSASAWQAANLNSKAQKITTRKTANVSVRDFIMAYIGLMEAERTLNVALDEERRVEAHRSDAQALFDAGSVTRNDVLQAEVALDEARLRVITGKDDVIRRSAAINSLLLLPVTDPVSIETTELPHPELPAYDDAILGAIEQRPEVQALRFKVQAKEAELRVRWAEYMPTIYVTGGYEYKENPYMVYEDNWSAYAGATMNLFSGGATFSGARQARAELETLRTELEKFTLAARLEVQNAYLTLTTARERLAVARHAMEQATEALRVQQARYEEGDETSSGVLDAVATLSRAEQNNSNAIYGLGKAEALYLYAAGIDMGRAYAGNNNEISTGGAK